MKAGCPREHEVMASLFSRGWPDQHDESLAAHARECQVCRDLVEVVSVMREEQDSLQREGVSVPAAGQVWWRAAIRARLEATQTASRPLNWLYGLSGACVIGLFVATLGLLWPPVQQAATWIGTQAWTFMLGLNLGAATTTLSPLAQMTGLVLLAVTACLLLAPVALYLALSDD
jgi:hypothetical protein